MKIIMIEMEKTQYLMDAEFMVQWWNCSDIFWIYWLTAVNEFWLTFLFWWCTRLKFKQYSINLHFYLNMLWNRNKCKINFQRHIQYIINKSFVCIHLLLSILSLLLLFFLANADVQSYNVHCLLQNYRVSSKTVYTCL